MRINVTVDNNQEESVFRGYKGEIKKAVSFVLDNEKFPYKSDVYVSLVTPEEIKRLNSEFRDKDSVTDVLSFPMTNGKDSITEEDITCGRVILGDVIICPKRIREQAKEFENTFENELILMSIHSVLHLLGYDHIKKRDREIMFPLQEKYLKMFFELKEAEKKNG